MISIKSFLTLYLGQLSLRYDESEAKAMLHYLLRERLQLGYTELLLLDKDTALSSEDEEILCQQAERLLRGESLQYILGYAYFFDQRLLVSPAVLIPRPETEELVELVRYDIEQTEEIQALQILDIGTGSACIPVGLATQIGSKHIRRIDAIDLSPEALRIAQQNTAKHRELFGMNLYEADLFELSSPFVPGGYDVLISNPPYIHPNESVDMSESVLQWEPSLALFAPSEAPTIYYDAIATLVGKSWLRAGGRIYLELNPLYATLTLNRMKAIIGEERIASIELRKDLSGKERFLIVRLR